MAPTYPDGQCIIDAVPGSFRSQLVDFRWSKAEPLHALLCMPGLALPLIVGVSLGYNGTAVLMAGGAQCVGMGSYQQVLFRRSGAMLAATFGIALSALAGALCRDNSAALMLAAVLWAFVYGMSYAIGPATSWVGQQCCIFLVISSAAPSTPGTTHDLVYSALLRGAGVLAGGLLQTGLLSLLLRWIPDARTQFTRQDFDPRRFQVDFLLRQFTPRAGVFQFSLRMVLTAVAAIGLYRAQTWTSAYWIGMTALLLPKPEWGLTVMRGLQRVAGTLIGALLCTFVVVELRPGGGWLIALTLLFLFGTYLLNAVNYAWFTLAVTGYICFVLAIANQPPREVLQHRVLATLIGTAVALAVHGLFIATRSLLHIPAPTLESIEDQR